MRRRCCCKPCQARFSVKNGNSSTIYTPPADFTIPSPGKPVVKFIDESIPSSGATIIEWYWDFGDGGFSTQQNPTHTYQQSGIYRVQLGTVDDKGCTSATVRNINILITGRCSTCFPQNVPDTMYVEIAGATYRGSQGDDCQVVWDTINKIWAVPIQFNSGCFWKGSYIIGACRDCFPGTARDNFLLIDARIIGGQGEPGTTSPIILEVRIRVGRGSRTENQDCVINNATYRLVIDPAATHIEDNFNHQTRNCRGTHIVPLFSVSGGGPGDPPLSGILFPPNIKVIL
jgi:hypothetical protein